MADAVASRQLDKAQSVTMRMKPSGFRIDGDAVSPNSRSGEDLHDGVVCAPRSSSMERWR